MKIFVGQIYIQAGVRFPFSHIFQHFISDALSSRVKSSALFDKKYQDFAITFNMSAKKNLVTPEIRGPQVFKSTKDVEYFIYLPFREWDPACPNSLERPLEFLFASIVQVLRGWGMDTAVIERDSEEMISYIVAHREMLE